MQGSIRDVAAIGLVHHMLYPRCTMDENYHAETLSRFVKRDDIDMFDFCLPYDEKLRAGLIPVVRSSGKPRCYATHLIPLRKLSYASVVPSEQAIMRILTKNQMAAAHAAGATEFIFASGSDVPEDKRPAARTAFREMLRWMCTEMKPLGITALLEPFDRTFDKKFLFGPSIECIDMIRSLEPEVKNLGIELDMAHVPLMDETFEHAIRTCAPYLKRVHLGNCVKKDPSNPWYGDNHPPMGIAGGEIDVPELAGILRLLADVGYIGSNRGALIIEMQPFPGMSEDDTVKDNFARLDKAWAMA
ncbi:MAG: sugar phosphate isomerase/epimerase [Spirochaetes bacterium]|nr:sugar phosphate isomerase/epimerase [Spirochaetota bacterium]